MRYKIESKYEIYIRVYNKTLCIAEKTQNNMYYKMYDIEELTEAQKNSIRNFMKINKTIPINIMWQDLQELRKLGFKI